MLIDFYATYDGQLLLIIHLKMCFKLSILDRQGPSNVARPVITYPPILPLDGTGCVNLRVN